MLHCIQWVYLITTALSSLLHLVSWQNNIVKHGPLESSLNFDANAANTWSNNQNIQHTGYHKSWYITRLLTWHYITSPISDSYTLDLPYDHLFKKIYKKICAFYNIPLTGTVVATDTSDSILGRNSIDLWCIASCDIMWSTRYLPFDAFPHFTQSVISSASSTRSWTGTLAS